MQPTHPLGPTEVSFLFISPDIEPGIVALDEQMNLSEGDYIATQSDGTPFIGQVLWQGGNNHCWVCELTSNGHSWVIKVIRCCELMKISRLEYSLALGNAKAKYKVETSGIGNRLQQISVDVARLNNLGSPKNQCDKCQIPMVAVITRDVVTQFVVVDKRNSDRIKISDPTDVSDEVTSTLLYCPSCSRKIHIDWPQCELVPD
jgi:hypothetical protein